jgi:tRNA G10  N-methylase Trm11
MQELRNNAFNIELTMRNLPKLGYVAFLGKQAVAAGFLRRVEPNYAQLDTFITDPNYGSKIRGAALEMIWTALESDAKDLKLKGIIALTVDSSIAQRAKDEGFQLVEQSVLIKPL